MPTYVLDCFVMCLRTTGLLLPILALSATTAFLLVAYRLDRGFRPLMGAQMTLTGAISISLASMQCYMSTWLWAYLGLVTAGAAALFALHTLAGRRLRREAMGAFPQLAELEGEFGFPLVVLGTQRVRAVAHRGRIFLSVGLLELLDDDQLRAVVAHEAYHLEEGPSRLASMLLAMTSLTFHRFDDDRAADEYAARLVGREPLVDALRILGIKDNDRRAVSLASPQ